MYALIVVDYNSIQKTIHYIEEFYRNVIGASVHAIIVDNSPQSHEQYIVSHYKGFQVKRNSFCGYEVVQVELDLGEIAYCWSGANLGYAKGNNLGTRLADEIYDDSYYIISNNDIVFNERLDLSCFETLFQKYPDVAVIGPRVIGMDGKTQSPHKKVGAFKYLFAGYWFKYWPFRWKPDYDYTNVSKRCYRVMGSFLLIKADVFRRIHGFDPNTFMFAEEMILSERLAKYGYGCYYYNDITIIHEHGVSVRNAASQLVSEQWAFDSICYYFKRYRGTKTIVLELARLNFALHKARILIRITIKNLYRSIEKKSEEK